MSNVSTQNVVYNCPSCGEGIADWVLKSSASKCPSCDISLVSNRKEVASTAYKTGLLIFCAINLVCLSVLWFYSGDFVGSVMAAKGYGMAALFVSGAFVTYQLKTKINLVPSNV